MNPRAVTPAPIQEPLSWPPSPAWVGFFQGLYAGAQPQHGTTAQRPTNPTLWQQYGDETLGKPIWCKTVSPVVWVDATGAAV